MRICIDCRSCLAPTSGIQRYIRNLIHGLASMDQENEYYLYYLNTFSPWSRLSSFRLNPQYKGIGFPNPVYRILARAMPSKWLTLNKITGEKIDLFHATNLLQFPHTNCKSVVTVHDLTFLLFPEFHTKKNIELMMNGLNGGLKLADRIIADSQSTKEDLVQQLKIPQDRINVIYLGVGAEYKQAPDGNKDSNILKKYSLQDPYLLFIGVIEPRKNLVRLIRAFYYLKEDKKIEHKLVIAGRKGWLYDDIFETVATLKLRNDVIFTGYIPDEDMPSLIRGSDFFVYPSLYEGFGLPPLEAMACGTPVITSNVSSLPEVVGDGALLVDPHSVEEISGGMAKLLEDDVLRKKLVRKGLERAKRFTWDRVARETLKVYEEIYRA